MGRVGRPGIVRIWPKQRIGKPVPTEARTSLMVMRKPRGVPFNSCFVCEGKGASWPCSSVVCQNQVWCKARIPGFGFGSVVHAIGAVDLAGDGLDLGLDRFLNRVSQRNLNLLGLSQALITASASAIAPLPPSIQWRETTASIAPASIEAWQTLFPPQRACRWRA